MARPKGSKNKPKIVPANANASPPPPANHNQLTDEQQQALFEQHKTKYEHFLALKKKADADFKNACKLAKSELGDGAVDDIKLSIQLETPEGEAEFKEEMDRKARVARWKGLPIGMQASLFVEDRTPGDERAFGEGKRAGMAGKERRAPYDAATSQFRKWLEGYDAGQEVNRSLMKDAIRPPKAKADAPATDPFDDALPAGQSDKDWEAAAPESVA
ncbi:hypothetical protein [Xanthobacter flavus]|uniref:hypothetical protein n=1 Tax=Xanthobacter flavus TaxID=281 RepID=UPI00372CA79F